MYVVQFLVEGIDRSVDDHSDRRTSDSPSSTDRAEREAAPDLDVPEGMDLQRYSALINSLTSRDRAYGACCR